MSDELQDALTGIEDDLLPKAKSMAFDLLKMSQALPGPDDRCAAKVAHNRVNVVAFELEHCAEAIRSHLGGSTEQEPDVGPGEQTSLF